MSPSIEQHIVNQAKKEIYSPERHGHRIIKWPVQQMGQYYLVEFECVTYEDIKKWKFIAIHEHKGGLRKPDWLLY